jgi:uncharacterized protein (TIGR02284 family)
MRNEDIIFTSTDLIDVRKGDAANLEACVTESEISSSRLLAMFQNMQHECIVAATELQKLVRVVGGKNCAASNADNGVFRSWQDLRTSLVDDDVTLIDREFEEDMAVRRYKVVLDLDLPSNVRAIVERQYQDVLVNHEQIKLRC